MNNYTIFIRENKEISENIYSLRFVCGPVAEEAVPGQFIQLRLSGHTHFTLRRPLSIASVNGDEVEVVYRVAGEGTAYLSGLKEGSLEVLGPLGNGFKVPETGALMLIAGGIGAAPLKFLKERLERDGRDFTFLYGARTGNEFITLGDTSSICLYTEDGTAGEKGMVTRDLAFLIEKIQPSMIFACGPEAMLKAVTELALAEKIPAGISLEEKMGCGLGACLCCVCETREGYRRVCSDGPVFMADEVVI